MRLLSGLMVSTFAVVLCGAVAFVDSAAPLCCVPKWYECTCGRFNFDCTGKCTNDDDCSLEIFVEDPGYSRTYTCYCNDSYTPVTCNGCDATIELDWESPHDPIDIDCDFISQSDCEYNCPDPATPYSGPSGWSDLCPCN